MGRRWGALALGIMLGLAIPGAAYGDHHGRHRHHHDDGDCDWRGDCSGDWQGGGGNGNKGRSGDDQRGDKNCHSFCGNTIIIPPLPGMRGGTTTTTTSPKNRGEEPMVEPSPACLVPVPYHCDPKPGRK
jgi:hypothetical protein